MRRLWIVRGAHDVALQLFAENPGIAPLYACGHGLAHKWKSLVTIQAAELKVLAIKEKAFRSEAGLAKADASIVAIENGASTHQLDSHAVKSWVVDTPQLNCGKTLQSDLTRACARSGIAGDNAISIKQLGGHFQTAKALAAGVKERLHSQLPVRG